MKKFAVLALAALLLAGPMTSAASAMSPVGRRGENLEADRGRRDFRRDRGRRPPPRPSRRSGGGGGNFAGALIGSAIGGLIAGAIANSRDEPDVYYVEPTPPVIVQPAPPPVIVQPAQPVLVCDQYGNCWYEY